MTEPTPPPAPERRSAFLTFLDELRRRKVYRVAAGYAVAVFALLEGADLVLPTLGVPDWVYSSLVWIALLGFPVAMILAWAFDVTPQGVQPDPAGRHAPATPLAFKVGGVVASFVIVAAGLYFYLQVRADDAPASEAAPPPALTSGGASPVAAAAGPQSIAVLPFTTGGDDRDLTYLGDGIAEELLTLLTRGSGLRVAAWSSSYKLRGEDPATVGRRLGVAYVLDGTIRGQGDSVRIVAYLADTGSQTQLWRDTFHGGLDDLFALQDSVALGVAQSLAVSFSSGGADPVARPATSRPGAYTAYLQGRQAANTRTPDGLAEALAHYRRAVELDPDFAEAFAAMAIAYSLQPVILSEIPGEAYPRAREAAEAALALDPDLAEAHVALANVLSDWEWDWAGSEASFLRALTLRPEYALGRQWYAQLLAVTGRPGQALEQAEEAVRMDPLTVSTNVSLGINYYMARHYEDAAERFRAGVEQFPNQAAPLELLGWAYREMGRLDDAIRTHEQAVTTGQGPLARGSLALALAAAGRTDEARAMVRRLEAEDAQLPVLATRIGLVNAHLGQLDPAFRWLETALDRRDPWIIYLNVDPAFDPLRDDPRFDALVERLGLPRDGER